MRGIVSKSDDNNLNGPDANTHRETSVNDTSNDIDSWTDKF